MIRCPDSLNGRHHWVNEIGRPRPFCLDCSTDGDVDEPGAIVESRPEAFAIAPVVGAMCLILATAWLLVLWIATGAR